MNEHSLRVHGEKDDRNTRQENQTADIQTGSIFINRHHTYRQVPYPQIDNISTDRHHTMSSFSFL